MSNFFSGHNMANNIMRQTSPTLQMREYQNDYNVGRVRTEEFHPERLNVDYETTKPYLPVPEPVHVVHIPGLTMPKPEPTKTSLVDVAIILQEKKEEIRSNLVRIQMEKDERARKAMIKYMSENSTW